MRNKQIIALATVLALLSGCDNEINGYTPVSVISQKGLAKSAIQISDGQVIRLWGFIDYGNLYGDASTRGILGELWSGHGPTSGHWRFNLKARADDATGNSFAVRVPNDKKRDAILKLFATNARAGKPTRVFLKGRIYTFEAPSNFVRHTGLYMELTSSEDILIAPDDPE